MSTDPTWRHSSTTFAFVAVFLLSLMGPWAMIASAQATDDESYTTQSGRHEIAWTGEWQIIDDLTIEISDAEVVFLSRDSAVLTVSFLPANADLVEVRDSLLEGFPNDDGADQVATAEQVETIDAGEYGDVAYALDRATLSGDDVGVFTLVLDRGPESDTIATMMIAPVETFSAEFQSAQRDITVDQDEIFTGIDPQGLQELLGAPGSQAAAPTPQPTVAAAPTSTQTAEQPTGGITSQEEAYLAAVLDDAYELAAIMDEVGTLFTQAGQNPNLILDTTWITEVAAVLVRWQILSEDMRDHNPSSRQQHIQDMWLEISTANLRAIDLIILGIDNLDPDALTRGTACINYSTALANDVTRAITAFYEDPDAPFQRQNLLSPGSTCESFSN